MFKKIFVEITNRCNLACDFCPGTRRVKGDLAPPLFARLLPQLIPFTRHLALHVLGEPLLHPQLDQLLALCHQHGFQAHLTSNGTLLPGRAGMLLAAPALRQVNLSLHSSTGQRADFASDGYLSEVLTFSRRAAAQGVYISLRIWDLPAAPGVAGGSGQTELLTFLAEYFTLAKPILSAETPGQGVKLAERIFLSQKKLFVWPSLSGPDLGGQGRCRGLRDQLAILVDGTVVPCCLDGEGLIPLGNAFAEPFAEIVAGARAQRIRQGFRERKVLEELCRRCSYRQRF